MIELNLLPDVKREFIKAQKTRNKVISGSILLMLGVGGALAVLAFFAFGAQQVHQRILDGQISERSQKLNDQKDLENYLTIQNQLAKLPELHSAKGTYSRLFDYLIKVNPAAPDNVNISKLTLDATSKTLAIEGFADNYRSLNVFQKTLESAELVYRQSDAEVREVLFPSVVMSQVGVGEKQSSTGATRQVTSFTAVLTFTDKAFASDITSPDVQVPNKNITNSDAVNTAPKTFESNPEGSN